MSKFKVGDKVVVTAKNLFVPVGSECRVIEVIEDSEECCLNIPDNVDDLWFKWDEIELVSELSCPAPATSDLEKRVSETRDNPLRNVFS